LVNNLANNGFSSSSESVQQLDLTSAVIGASFAALPASSISSSSVLDLTTLEGQPDSVAVIQNLYENVTLEDGATVLESLGPSSLSVYDNGAQRPGTLGPGSFNCVSLQPGPTAQSLYCASSNNFSQLTANSGGVSLLSSVALPAGNGSFTGMVFSAGKVFTTTGLVIDVKAGQVVGTMPAQGPVAVDGDRVYWLDPSVSTYPGVTSSTQSTVAVRSFDASTLQSIDVRLVNVTKNDVTRIVASGEGRVAFRAGKQIYVVNPSISSSQAASISLIAPVDSSVPVVQAGSWISIYGQNLANATEVWNNDFPTSLGGVTVTVDKRPAYLFYVSPAQINVQVPDDSTLGLVTVVVNTPNGSVTSTVLLSSYSPALSLFDQKYVAGVIPTPNGSGAYGGGTYDLVGPVGQFSFQTRPVKVGEAIELFGFGFGPTSPAVPAGQAFVGSAPTDYQVPVTIGGVPATVLYSGLTEAGLYQLNVVVPKVDSGDQLVQATVNGNAVTPAAYVTVQ
jgi:uncharacterized protein (TIGR03437 family)